MKKLVLGLTLVGLMTLTGCGDYCYGEEGTATVKHYCWGLGFNRVADNPDQAFVQINGDACYKFPNQKFLKDLYVYMGINTNKNFTGGIGYYLWEHRVGIQVGDIYTRNPGSEGEDDFCYGIFLGTGVMNYLWEAVKQSGNMIFETK